MIFIIHLVVAMLICAGIWNAFTKGQILGWLGDIWEKRLPNAINKPLWMCMPCLASFWGTLIWFLVFDGDRWMWIPFVLALSGLNRIIAHNLL